MTTPYDLNRRPPAPVLTVRFGRNGEQTWLGPFEALVDTGADVTIVPNNIPQLLKLTPINPGQLESQWGDVHPVNIYIIDIEIEGQILPVSITAGDSTANEIILGRSVLNHLALFVDSPKLQTA